MNIIKRLKKNTVGTDYFVGDIHGCYDLLMNRLAEIKFDTKKDRLISVGDLVDRGPDSIKCLGLLNETWFHAVMGNHEEMMYSVLNRLFPSSTYIKNGGAWFLSEPPETQQHFVDLSEEMMSLVIEVETDVGNIGVLHANAPDDWIVYSAVDDDAIDDSTLYDTTWGRDRIYGRHAGPVKNIDYVVVGHTPVNEVVNLDNIVYIDTGAVFKRPLTILTAKEVAQYANRAN